MKYTKTVVTAGVVTGLVAGVVALISCAQAPQSPVSSSQAVNPANENGRFQVIVKPEPQGQSILFLVDTRTGDTWIYRPPQPPTFNGYWSDIPRMTYPPAGWQQAFQILFTPQTNVPPPAAPAVPPATGTGAPPAAAGTPGGMTTTP
ncbi:MAG: hypothetical protein N3B01_09640 [Verrucomicrobiae bacterium]|nr:hypothetical protein [Verrucomicrobiae bacterium]